MASVLATCGEAVAAAYPPEKIDDLLAQAPVRFDRAFDRWRELYQAAMTQFQDASTEYQRARGRQEQANARRRQDEANRQRNLLLNSGTRRDESDFYPYRYLAAEGFLPGYNFPRLPVRLFVSGRRGQEDGSFISRPRFLALTEFGPRNVVYHEGSKFQVTRNAVAAAAIEQRFRRAKLCLQCGYLHEADDAEADRCHQCNSILDGAGALYSDSFFEMPTAAGVRSDRITCDEEERVRRGYEVTTQYRWGPTRHVASAQAGGERDGPVLELTYGPAATLWRINHRWRRSPQAGFGLDLGTGQWRQRQGPADDVPDHPPDTDQELRLGVRLFVRDTRNVLRVAPAAAAEPWSEEDLATFQYALQRGIEQVYQLEENELASERIGEEHRRAILLWEAAEGGAGVLRHLVEEPQALAGLADAILERCHFDPATGTDRHADCAQACYECLLSYTNQRDHLLLNRHMLPALLRGLASGHVALAHGERTDEEHYAWLRANTDESSDLERRFLDHLATTQRRLPDHTQALLADYPTRPDFYYEEARACVYCDGTVHDQPAQAADDQRIRLALRDLGYRVIVIRYDQVLEAQISTHSDLFGAGDDRP